MQRFLDSISRNSIKSKKTYSSALTHFQVFLSSSGEKYNKYNTETILEALLSINNKINVYELFDDFVSFLLAYRKGITPRSTSVYLVALKSYFAYYDIDVIPSKFRRRVKMPKLYREDEMAIDAEDIRKILLSCSNRRLKAYLLILASSGLRAVEAASIRLRDIDFSSRPVRIRIRKEYSKTRSGREAYISDEAAIFLRQWTSWKYRKRSTDEDANANVNGNGNDFESQDLAKWKEQEDLIFSIYSINDEPKPTNLYVKLLVEFEKLLKAANMDERKEGDSVYK